MRWSLEHIVPRQIVWATLKIIPVCQLALTFTAVSQCILKCNAVKMVNRTTFFSVIIWDISLLQSDYLCYILPIMCYWTSFLLTLATANLVTSLEVLEAPHHAVLHTMGFCVSGKLCCSSGLGSSPRWVIWVNCSRIRDSSGELTLFLEVFIAQSTVIKASMFSKGNEYFVGYVRKNLGT